MDMTTTLGGVTMPKVGPKGFQRLYTPNETDNQTINGNIFTDFISNHRTWVLSWDAMTLTDYQTVENVYLSQYSGNTFLAFVFTAFGISCQVKAKLDQTDIKYNGNLIMNVKLTLIEQLHI